jgi:hypothetical protein
MIGGDTYIRGWDRTVHNTAPYLWNYDAPKVIVSIASKTTTTWFLAGTYHAIFYKGYF